LDDCPKNRARRLLPLLLLSVSALYLGIRPSPARADTVGSGSDFLADKKVRAINHPKVWATFSPPASIVPGDTYTVDCTFEAYKKTGMQGPQKGIKGSVSLLLVSLDVASLTWSFDGVTGAGLPFETDEDGVAFVTTGDVVAGNFFSNPGPNDTILGWVEITGGRKVRQTYFRCELSD